MADVILMRHGNQVSSSQHPHLSQNVKNCIVLIVAQPDNENSYLKFRRINSVAI